jgi:hypothetical protein
MANGRVSKTHPEQMQIYDVYYSSMEESWSIKDRYANWTKGGINKKEKAVKMAVKRAKKDRPAKVRIKNMDGSVSDTRKYPKQ